ncbi:unnamed protein product [Thelazia callipaeda]|uniref:Protein kinase domain-containing protein n=1 Tax=Thelazia callipaeda TaxID=103827 RepID=A0A0N5CL45_THECL|nr:unnamed protein product [Thelazia callipaeda]
MRSNGKLMTHSWFISNTWPHLRIYEYMIGGHLYGIMAYVYVYTRFALSYAPLASDYDEEQQVDTLCPRGHKHREGVAQQLQLAQSKRPHGTHWHQASNSGSITTSSVGSYSGGRCSSEATTGSSPHGYISSKFSHHPMKGELDDLSIAESESEDQPAELIPLGMSTYSLSGCKTHRKKTRSHFTDFYKLADDHLGSGAYASVKTGISLATGKEFAIKLIDKHEAGHTRSRVMHEVETFNLCKNHPNIVQLHEWFEDHDRFYLVFQKMRGGPLLDHIQRKKFFTEQEASKVTKDIATALKFLHDRGIAHRDVKPENVLCSNIDHVTPVKLCDLDLASKASVPSPPRLTNVNSEPDLASPVGSAEFMAPEVVDAFVGDALKYDKRCDMWSLGVIVYIMICGYPPFYGECWRENCGWDQGLACNDCQESLFKRIQQGEFDFPKPEWEKVSKEAKDLICHLLVKNVRQRFTADEVLKHPWVKNGAPETKLQTPGNLFRNDSTRDVHQMQEHFNVMNRIVAARLSARIEQNELDSEDKLIDKQSIMQRLPKNKVSKNTTAEDNPAKMMDSKKNCNMVTAKVEATFREHSFISKINKTKANDNSGKLNNVQKIIMRKVPSHGYNVVHHAASTIPFINNDSNGATHYPVHVPQMPLASPVRFPYGVPLIQAQQLDVHLPSFQPHRIVTDNRMLYYPHMFPPPILTPQQLLPLQGIDVDSHSYLMNRAVNVVPDQINNSDILSVSETEKGQQLQSKEIAKRAQPQQVICGPVRRTMVTVRSAANLSGLSFCGSHQTEQLETCQGAVVKQDSKTDLGQCQARETQVNV